MRSGEEMEVEEKVVKEPLLYGGAGDAPGLEQMAFWNWTRIGEPAKKEREDGGCGGLGSG